MTFEEQRDALLMEARVQAFTHIGKQHETLEDAIEKMPNEFWNLSMEEKDEVEKRLTKYFKDNV
jgi:hypothetical protein